MMVNNACFITVISSVFCFVSITIQMSFNIGFIQFSFEYTFDFRNKNVDRHRRSTTCDVCGLIPYQQECT